MDNLIVKTPVTKTTFDEVVKNIPPKTDDKFIDKPTYTSEQLLSCLYFLFDAFERCGIDFFLVKQTAKDAMSDVFAKLTGDHIDIGVRKLEWENDQKDILFPYFEQEHVEITSTLPDKIEAKWQDIPFIIHLYDESPSVTALVPLVYQQEHWKIPNRFDIFEEKYDK